MIGRASARGIAEAYCAKFTYGGSIPSRGLVHVDKLYDFLYVNNFSAWLLNAIKRLPEYPPRATKDFLLRIHTGESLVAGTPDWDWKQREALGQTVLRDLAQAIISASHTDPHFDSFGEANRRAVDNMQDLLELDGYIYRDGILHVPEESVVDVAEEQGVLQDLVQELSLADPATIAHHLALSVEHYTNGRWDDSIGNSRKVLESVFQQVAVRHAAASGKSIAASVISRPAAVRDHLEHEGLLEAKQKEAFAKIYGLLSDTGGHPYIAQKDQARLMRHYALTTCQFVLLRLRGALKAPQTDTTRKTFGLSETPKKLS